MNSRERKNVQDQVHEWHMHELERVAALERRLGPILKWTLWIATPTLLALLVVLDIMGKAH